MKKHRLIKQLTIAALGCALWSGTLSAAAPLAGTSIGNQAKATYTDTSAQVREVFSNTVTTTVTQVAAFTLVDTQAKNATPGSQVFFSHTLTNTGNGPDTFNLARVVATGNLNNLAIYPDADQDGLPDNYTEILTTGQIAPGAAFHFVVAAIVPGSAVALDVATITVTANSTHATAPAAITNTDTVTVTNGAVMQVTKAINNNTGVPGTTATYTITYTNTGNATANNFLISDEIPTHMTYELDSGKWSVTGGTVLTDAADGTQGTVPNAIDYEYNPGTRIIKALITAVPAGQSGFITFSAKVDADVAPQVLPNTAKHKIDTGPEFPTNTVPFTVVQIAAVTLDGDTVATANAGSTVSFTNLLTNTGTGIDTFDITIAPGHTFPAGTTFNIFQSDGQTPMVDSTGNGIRDTGPLAPGATYDVVLKANLPSGAAAGGPYKVNKVATSTFNNTVDDDADDILTLIVGAGVDVTNNIAVSGTAPGEGVGPEGTPVITNAANPGTTTTFTLVVNNTGPNPDTYDLLASGTSTFGTVNTLPAGWTVTFRKGGTAVTNTGTILGGSQGTIAAEVFVPAGQIPGSVAVYFQALSPSTLVKDVIYDAVSVNTIRKIEIATSSAAQAFPGGSVVYEHILTNVGNVTEGTGAIGESDINLTLTDSLSGSAWNSVIYWDKNGDGSIDAGDPVVTSLSDDALVGIAPGASVRLLVKVFAPLGAADGVTNTTTITATTVGEISSVPAPAPVSNEDVTTVIRGDLKVVKMQALGDGSGNPLLPWSLNPQVAPPGGEIVYQITVTNIGSTDATSIVLYDTTPTHTTYNDVGGSEAAVTGDGTMNIVDSAPVTGSAGNFAFNVGDLAASKTATITFGVKIDGL